MPLPSPLRVLALGVGIVAAALPVRPQTGFPSPPPNPLPALPNPPPAAPPPPPAAPPPSEPPAASAAPRPDTALEAALRARLFAGPLAAEPAASGDPAATEWEQARAKGQRPACEDVGPLRYLQTRADLDGDARPETLALVVGSFACGGSGCTLLVFRGEGNGLAIVHESGLFQSPLVAGTRRHAGWLDLAMPGSSLGVSSGWMELRFDGTLYRPFPSEGEDTAPIPEAAPALLTMPPLPFEQLGQPLPCAP